MAPIIGSMSPLLQPMPATLYTEQIRPLVAEHGRLRVAVDKLSDEIRPI